MAFQAESKPKILIASSHPLFSKGLISLIKNQWGENIEVVGLASTIDETFNLLGELAPDLLIVDYDDVYLNQNEILSQFITGSRELRIVLLSLNDGEKGSEAVVFDRRTMKASKIKDWIEITSKVNSQNEGLKL